jgi:hypothetical protein
MALVRRRACDRILPDAFAADADKPSNATVTVAAARLAFVIRHTHPADHVAGRALTARKWRARDAVAGAIADLIAVAAIEVATGRTRRRGSGDAALNRVTLDGDTGAGGQADNRKAARADAALAGVSLGAGVVARRAIWLTRVGALPRDFVADSGFVARIEGNALDLVQPDAEAVLADVG